MFVRYGALTVVVSALLISSGTGCKSGESDGGSGGSGGSTTTAPLILPPTNGGTSCQSGGTCTDQAAIDEYADCIVTTCDAQYKQCFGDDYLSGTVGGSCGDLLTCAMDCEDCDQACLTACSDQHFTGDCKACILGPIADCAIQAITGGVCALPCGPTTSTGGPCDDLKTCCASLTAAEQAQCDTTYNQIKLGGDAACTSVLKTYQLGGSCP